MSSATEAGAARPREAGLRDILDAFLAARGRLEDNLESLAKRNGLCGSQILLVLDVLAHPGTGLTELCGRTGLKKSLASKQADALVGKGLLARTGVEGDRRALALTVDSAKLEAGFCAEAGLRSIFPGWGAESGSLDSLLDSFKGLSRLLEPTT